MTAAELRAFAVRCAERGKEGLMISPSAVSTVVDALRLLAESREKVAGKRKR